MEEKLSLEKELQARIFVHKVAIVGGILQKEFTMKENNNPIKLPPFEIAQQAELYSNTIIQKAIADETFNQLYNNSWDKIKNIIPDNLCVMQG